MSGQAIEPQLHTRFKELIEERNRIREDNRKANNSKEKSVEVIRRIMIRLFGWMVKLKSGQDEFELQWATKRSDFFKLELSITADGDSLSFLESPFQAKMLKDMDSVFELSLPCTLAAIVKHCYASDAKRIQSAKFDTVPQVPKPAEDDAQSLEQFGADPAAVIDRLEKEIKMDRERGLRIQQDFQQLAKRFRIIGIRAFGWQIKFSGNKVTCQWHLDLANSLLFSFDAVVNNFVLKPNAYYQTAAAAFKEARKAAGLPQLEPHEAGFPIFLAYLTEINSRASK